MLRVWDEPTPFCKVTKTCTSNLQVKQEFITPRVPSYLAPAASTLGFSPGDSTNNRCCLPSATRLPLSPHVTIVILSLRHAQWVLSIGMV